jgi:hypothetical protein
MLVEVLEPISTIHGFLTIGEIIRIPDSVAERLSGKIKVISSLSPKAEIIENELRLREPVKDLWKVIIELTRNDLKLQKQLLLQHCQRYSSTHFWAIKEKWDEKTAIIEYDGDCFRPEAQRLAAEMYGLTAFLPELQASSMHH